ncbi:MAG: hypothetical protein QME27_07715 [Syntrophaceae bacterium]|nr:hypothetical protein [Syntrophaceae bacterium]
MTKEKLLDILKKVLQTDHDLDFLLRLSAEELKTLVLHVRDRVDRPWADKPRG